MVKRQPPCIVRGSGYVATPSPRSNPFVSVGRGRMTTLLLWLRGDCGATFMLFNILFLCFAMSRVSLTCDIFH
jgi:hypothetical protein